MCGPKKGRLVILRPTSLTTESVQGPALSLQGVHDVHSRDGLPLGVLCVGDGVSDDIFQEHLQYTTGLLVDQTRDSLHTTSASKTADGGLRDTLDVVTKNFPVTLSASFSKTFSSFTTSRHVDCVASRIVVMTYPRIGVVLSKEAFNDLDLPYTSGLNLLRRKSLQKIDLNLQ